MREELVHLRLGHRVGVANPVEAGLVARPAQYRWSSYRAYFSPTWDWIDADSVLRRFGRTRADATRRLRALLDPVAGLAGSYERLPRHVQAIVGESDFATGVLQRNTDPELIRRDVSLERVAAAVASELSLPESTLRARQQPEATQARALAGLLARDVAAIPLARTARYFGRGRSTISRQVARLELQLREDQETMDQVRRVRERILPRPKPLPGRRSSSP